MSSLNPNPKRKPTPQWATPTPGPGIGASPAPSSAASEEGGTPKKKVGWGIGQYGLSTSDVPSGLGRHDGTNMMLIVDAIKRRKTINIEDIAFMPELGGEELSENVLEMVKNHERVEYNEDNGVFEYRAELEVNSIPELISEIKKKSHLAGGVSTKALRQSWPQAVPALEDLEKEGKVLIMRGFPGLLNQMPLPPLGGRRMDGSTVMDGGPARWKGVWWDEVRERGEVIEKIDEDFITLWGEIQLKETDDVVELLRQHDFEASNGEQPAKPVAKSSAPVKKKRKVNRVNQKVTNSHMKEFGVDFSKDFDAAASK